MLDRLLAPIDRGDAPPEVLNCHDDTAVLLRS
jgi:hypothetical protein